MKIKTGRLKLARYANEWDLRGESVGIPRS